jgi:superfamily II DNA or RNA helicase
MTSPERRRFSGRERNALYLAANGLCECPGCEACGPGPCGRPLEPGWNADHAHPYSRHGETDMINGQAMCPPCNRKKGATVLRDWQQQAKEQFLASGKRDFLVSATPGAGKTRFALDLARDLVNAGEVQRIAIVVPTDPLRTQWSSQGDAFGLPLVPVDEAADYDKRGYAGCVVTYQQLQYGALNMKRATRVPTLVILDEIHHAGESRSWGDALEEAFEHAKYRLALTGTPWRRDKRFPIPFVAYDKDGKVQVDKAYEYGEAVADGVCRAVEFHAYDGEANWKDPALPEPLVSLALTEVGKDDTGIALSTVFGFDSPWILTLLEKGAEALDTMRLEVPDAAGLVVADNQNLAECYAAELERITREKPALAVSNNPEAKGVIDAFRAKGATQRWIVAVRMVSEGVDIPRLGVGIYATRARTPLLFRQIVGRFVRTRTDFDPNSLMFIPAVREFADLARDIEEELRHQLEEETKRELAARDEQLPFEMRESLSASEAKFDRAIFKGDEVTPGEMDAARAECRRYGIPETAAAAVARMLRERGQSVPVLAAEVSPGPARHQRERLLRKQVETHCRRLAYKAGIPNKQVAVDLMKAGFPSRDKATVEELAEMEQTLLKWLSQV